MNEDGDEGWIRFTPAKYYPYMRLAMNDTYRVINEFGVDSAARRFDEKYHMSLIKSIADAHGVEGLPHCAIADCSAAAEVGITVECDFEEDVIQIEGEDIFDDYPDVTFGECLAAIPICRNCELTTRSDTFLELDVSECIIYSAPQEMVYHYFEHCEVPFEIKGWKSRCPECKLTLDQMDHQDE